jgi:CMP-N-acetylneuraminic acid synthetase
MLDGRTVLIVVPARGGSKGIKLKNIRPLKGVPLVALVGKVVKQLDYVDRAVVSTDHPGIAKIAREAGLDVPFMRPESISGDIVADWDVLHHALLATEEYDNKTYDVIVMLPPTSPFRQPKHVTATVKKLMNGNFDAVWTVSETDSKSHPLKQLILNGEIVEYYDPVNGPNIIARQQLSQVYHLNGIAYAFTRDCLVKQKTKKGKKTSAVVVNEPIVNIDTDFDLKLAEFLMEKRLHK